jgi:D-alanyl-lipoteichoic acid acyltransferase DltB (MBOAT superfamily)
LNLSESSFLLFLAGVVPLYALLSRMNRRVPVTFLVVASLLFYATWNPWYLLPLSVTSVVDYGVGRGLGAARGRWTRRALLAASLGVDLTLLVSFKYFDTLLAAWSHLPHLGALQPPFRILFMTGISFYTLQSLGYVLDVHGGFQAPQRSFLRYFAFVAFFPTLLAGPISRAETLMPQLEGGGHAMDPTLASRGLFLIALGFVKKCVIADFLADQLVNRVFEQPLFYSSAEILSAIYAYAIQIYCDFSGYTDIALGAALLLGFQLKDNFRFPYRAASLAEFWKRWHISFSNWLMDHVFAALPGRRRGSPLPYVNIVLTFIVGGLWHGASFCFLAWGLIHGGTLALERLWDRGPRKARPAWRKGLRIVLTFHVVLLAWVFFRADSLDTVRQMAGRLADLTTGMGNVPLPVLLLVPAVLASQALPERAFEALRDRFAAWPALVQTALLLATGAAVRLASGARIASFIYQGF